MHILPAGTLVPTGQVSPIRAADPSVALERLEAERDAAVHRADWLSDAAERSLQKKDAKVIRERISKWGLDEKVYNLLLLDGVSYTRFPHWLRLEMEQKLDSWRADPRQLHDPVLSSAWGRFARAVRTYFDMTGIYMQYRYDDPSDRKSSSILSIPQEDPDEKSSLAREQLAAAEDEVDAALREIVGLLHDLDA